ncbi:unnamed protein product [Prorocentrum cordatum]|uniref:Vesicle transport protein n=1 Tax=Prorocentrum cordatum TaxID=2364126 RepID=A0ABN9W6V9_9DINO|nr:unnamed protein product [Polarella glacialis]
MLAIDLQLTSLGLGENKQLSGDIQAVGTLVDLIELRLGATKIGGDIMAAQSLMNLTTLWLQNIQVSGDAQAVETLVNLTYLRLDNTKVTGDIQAVRNVENLTIFRFSNIQAPGDAQAMEAFIKLTVLGLHNTKIMGDIWGVRNLVNLTALDLEGTQVSGDIQAVQNHANLTVLSFGDTQVLGDIQAVQILADLTKLGLFSTAVTGDIQEQLQARLTEMEWVDFDFEMRLYFVPPADWTTAQGRLEPEKIECNAWEGYTEDGRPQKFLKYPEERCLKAWQGDKEALRAATDQCIETSQDLLVWLLVNCSEPVPFIRLDFMLRRLGPGKAGLALLASLFAREVMFVCGPALPGTICIVLGVMLLFDRTLLALGNIAFLLGLGMLLGPTKAVKFFLRKEKWKGTTAYFSGIGVIVFGWPFCGFLLEMYGVWKLFAAFLPNVLTSLKMTVPGASMVLNTWPLSAICNRINDQRRLPN